MMATLALRGWLMPDESLSAGDKTVVAVFEIIAFALGWNGVDKTLSGSWVGVAELCACAIVSYSGFKWPSIKPILAPKVQLWIHRYRVWLLMLVIAPTCLLIAGRVRRYYIAHWTIAAPAPPIKWPDLPPPQSVIYPTSYAPKKPKVLITKPVTHKLSEQEAKLLAEKSIRPGDIYPDPSLADVPLPALTAEAELVAMSDLQLRKHTTDRAKEMKAFEFKYQKVDRPEIGVNDDDPESVKAYWVEMDRRDKEDAQRERQYSNDFQQQFSDIIPLCNEIVKRCETKGISIDSNAACLSFSQAPQRVSGVGGGANTAAENLEGLARKCLN